MLAPADKGWKRACAEDRHLLNGLNVHAGKLTYAAVGEALGLPTIAATMALAASAFSARRDGTRRAGRIKGTSAKVPHDHFRLQALDPDPLDRHRPSRAFPDPRLVRKRPAGLPSPASPHRGMGRPLHDHRHDGLGPDAPLQAANGRAGWSTTAATSKWQPSAMPPCTRWSTSSTEGTLARIIEALPQTEIWTGWLAMLIFVPPAFTSNNAAQRWLHSGWKTLQRFSYPAAVLVLIHWASLHDWGGWVGPVVNFAPLIGLWAYRLWYWYLRPRPLAAA